MTRQMGQSAPEMPLAALDERLRALENRLDAISEAIHVVTHALEALPTAGPVTEAARQAHELLLLAQPRAGGAPVGGAAGEEP